MISSYLCRILEFYLPILFAWSSCEPVNRLSYLESAILAGDYEAVVQEIENGADVNEQDDIGWTPLMWAAGAINGVSDVHNIKRGYEKFFPENTVVLKALLDAGLIRIFPTVWDSPLFLMRCITTGSAPPGCC